MRNVTGFFIIDIGIVEYDLFHFRKENFICVLSSLRHVENRVVQERKFPKRKEISRARR